MHFAIFFYNNKMAILYAKTIIYLVLFLHHIFFLFIKLNIMLIFFIYFLFYEKKRLFNNIIQMRIDMIRYTVYVYSKQEEREREKNF